MFNNNTYKMETLEIRSNSIQVQTKRGGITVVARYDDKGGAYFLNENLEKQYAVVKEVEVVVEVIEEDEVEEYTFYVDAWVGDSIRNYTKRVRATSLEMACEKVEKAYKRIYSYEVA